VSIHIPEPASDARANCPRFSWPNDPQTCVVDAHVYRVVFAPRRSSIPITPAGPIPVCSTLPSDCAAQDQATSCAGDLAKGALFVGAVIAPSRKHTADCPIIPGSNPPGRYECNTSVLLVMVAVFAAFVSGIRTRRWVAAAGALILVIIIGGCGGSSSSSPTPPNTTSSVSVTDALTVGPISGLPLQVAKEERG
jgi:hypothetical protein